ncbi:MULTISPECIES: 16S rRNA (uracil(1498)-N(3))-methyltransferase [Ramlibacter]|uniref:Ribosomal RNA small subunit methyltransferase E n=1 Tax=Ramlibacter aquaticus TaxID=2780094 RepID=A0ABR9SIA6_9BURK|nr:MULTISPECIES: 16S rRNA (uracil(1498)-N(3))-methyltransferase [Ramlibacter]MBE7941909.1 16S rRNA (uracil(1498)-N(3))-methyltransferase [Ramlibacter aquaticus]
MPRLFCPPPLAAGQVIALPPRAARHVQVLRLQPGEPLTLFDSTGGEWDAQVERMGRQDVSVRLGTHHPLEREAPWPVHLAVAMPANERMDWLVEKATELGAAGFLPVQTSRSVLRLAGERADRKRQHWAAVAEAACEQCGRNRVPGVAPVADFRSWLAGPLPAGRRVILSTAGGARPFMPEAGPLLALSGPEGGFSPEEEQAALAAGFEPVTLGPRILRAETAPLALLAIAGSLAPVAEA